ncbi:MAG TPA: DedA family protein [Vicinamibacterales bacterium]|nr:DedA family protein [Vicinamibacterales bacterium]
MESTAAYWIAHFGVDGLFVLLALGVFGLPVPSETLLVLAGIMVSRGQMRLAPTIAAAISGTIVGISVSFAVGRFVGVPLLVRYGRVVHLSTSMLTRVEGWFERFGKWVLLVGYFIPGVRHVTAIVAGTAGLPVRIFSMFAYSGALLWVGCFLAIGYLLGDEWQVVVAHVYWYARIVVAAAVGAVVIYALWARHRRRRATLS